MLYFRLHLALTAVAALFVASVLIDSAHAQFFLISELSRFKLWRRAGGVTWNAAKKHCEDTGGWLAVDPSEESHEILLAVPNATTTSGAWLGATDQLEDNTWRWVTGPIGSEDNGRGRVFFTGMWNNNPRCILQICRWNAGEPNNSPNEPGEKFLMAYASLQWNDLCGFGHNTTCGISRFYCEYPSAPEVATAEIAGELRYFSRKAVGGISWYEARQICTVYNSSLAIEATSRDKVLLTRLAMLIPDGERAFIAGTDFAVRGTWRWTAGAVQAESSGNGRLFYRKAGNSCDQPTVGCRWSDAVSGPAVSVNASFAALMRTGPSTVEWVALPYPEKADGFICAFPPPTPTGTHEPTRSVSFSTSRSDSQSRSTSATPSLSRSLSTTLVPPPTPTVPPTRSATHSQSPPPTSSLSAGTFTFTAGNTPSTTLSVTPPPTKTKTDSHSTTKSGPTPSASESMTGELTSSATGSAGTATMSINVSTSLSRASPTVSTSEDQTASLSLLQTSTRSASPSFDSTLSTTYLATSTPTRTLMDPVTLSIAPSVAAVDDFKRGFTLVFTVGGSVLDQTQYSHPNFTAVVFTPRQIAPQFRNGFSGNIGAIWKRDFVFVNATHIVVQIPSIGNYFIGGDERIEFHLRSEGILARGKNVAPVTLVVQAPPKAFTEAGGAAEIAASVGSTVGAVSSASGAVAAQASRAKALLSLATCFFEYGVPLDWSVSPTGVAIVGGDQTRYHVGAAVMNPLIILAIGALHLLAAAAFSIGAKIPLRQGCASVYFPNLLFIPLMFFMQETITAVFVVLLHGEAAVARTIAGSTLVFWASAWALIFFRVFRINAVFVSFGQVPMQLSRRQRLVAALRWFFNGSGEWIDKEAAPQAPPGNSSAALLERPLTAGGEGLPAYLRYLEASSEKNDPTGAGESDIADTAGFCNRFGSMFDAYRPGATWFVVVDCLVVLLTGILMAIRPEAGACRSISASITGVIAVYLGLLVVIRPFFVPFRQVVFVVATALQLVSALALALPVVGVEQVGAMADILSMFFVVFSTIVDLLLMLTGITSSKGEKRKPGHSASGSGVPGQPPSELPSVAPSSKNVEHGVVNPLSSESLNDPADESPVRHKARLLQVPSHQQQQQQQESARGKRRMKRGWAAHLPDSDDDLATLAAIAARHRQHRHTFRPVRRDRSDLHDDLEYFSEPESRTSRGRESSPSSWDADLRRALQRKRDQQMVDVL